jgi:hypothetical protein
MYSMHVYAYAHEYVYIQSKRQQAFSTVLCLARLKIVGQFLLALGTVYIILTSSSAEDLSTGF